MVTGSDPRGRCTAILPPLWMSAIAEIHAIQARRGREADAASRAGRRSSCARPRAGPAGRGRRQAGRGNLPRPPGALGEVARTPSTWRMLEAWMRSYRPQSASIERAPGRRSRRARTEGERRMGATPHANGGRLRDALEMPDTAAYAIEVERPGASGRIHPPPRGAAARRLFRQRRAGNFRLFCPDETNSNRLGAVFEVEDRCLMRRRARATSTSRRTAA